MPFANCAISVSDVTAETKMEAFSRIRTKSGKNKTQGLKQKSPENVRTKSDFFPIFYQTRLISHFVVSLDLIKSSTTSEVGLKSSTIAFLHS